MASAMKSAEYRVGTRVRPHVSEAELYCRKTRYKEFYDWSIRFLLANHHEASLDSNMADHNG